MSLDADDRRMWGGTTLKELFVFFDVLDIMPIYIWADWGEYRGS